MFNFVATVWLIAGASALGLLIVLIILIFTLCGTVCYCVKRKRLLAKPVDSNPMQQQLEYVYEEPNELYYQRPEPEMHDNEAYGQAYHWNELREDWVENVVPNPQTQQNIAYNSL